VTRIKKLALVYVGYFPSRFLYGGSKFLYEWERQVLNIFECAKIWRMYHAYQSMNMNMMKMLDYQFIIQLPKVFT